MYVILYFVDYSHIHNCHENLALIKQTVLWSNINFRWYGTPCDIFKDDRILKNDYNYGFEYFKILSFTPKMQL